MDSNMNLSSTGYTAHSDFVQLLHCWKYKKDDLDFTIIITTFKDTNFHKIWRMWLKNWARHANLHLEILKGVAVSFFETHLPNFG